LGGGGLSSAAGEMAHRFVCGVNLHLENVPLKTSSLAPWEIYISESQERMLLLIPKENLRKALVIFRKEDVEATPIGELTDDKILTVFHKDSIVAKLDMDFLFSPPKTERSAKWAPLILMDPFLTEPLEFNSIILEMLALPNISSRENVVCTYDYEVKGNTVLKPLFGRIGGPSDAAVIKPLDESWKGITISCGINPSYGKIDPYWMAASAIDEAIRNNTATGGRRIALLDNFVWGNPENPSNLGSLVKACQACNVVARGFETPFISGKDSLYNESPLGSVTPTLLVTAVGIIPDIRKTVSLDLKTPGNPIYLLGKTFRELGGSEYYRKKGFVGSSVPKVRVKKAKNTVDTLIKAQDKGLVRACHDLSEGGLGVAAAEMAISGDYGITLNLKDILRTKDVDRNDFALFSESNSRFLVEVPEILSGEFESTMKNVPCAHVGEVIEESCLVVYGFNGNKIIDVRNQELVKAWKSFLGKEG